MNIEQRVIISTNFMRMESYIKTKTAFARVNQHQMLP